MKFLKFGIIALVSLAVISCGGGSSSTSTGAQELNFSTDNGGITLPDNFKAVVVSDSAGKARHITIAENGDIYIALSEPENGKGIAALRDTDGDGTADSTAYFGSYTGTGIQLYNGFLYFGSDTSIVRYPMQEGQLLPEGEAETVIGGFPEQAQHAAKSFTFDQSGHIYVNIGAPSNACQEKTRTPGSPGMDPCPQLENHAGVWQFNADSTGQNFQNDGQRYATGIRNAVALDWNNSISQLFLVQHGRDQLHSLWPDYYTVEENAQLPAEEMFAVNEGDNFGWPYTYYNWKTDQKMVAPEYGGNGKKVAEEGKYENPIIAFPGHWAPNDLIFYNASQFPEKYQSGAFIAFHGSWNRAPEPQQGYKVAFVPFEGDTVAGDFEVFANNFAGKDTLSSPGNAEYRPVGLAIGNDGSLFITDSQQGKVWRVVYTGDTNSSQQK